MTPTGDPRDMAPYGRAAEELRFQFGRWLAGSGEQAFASGVSPTSDWPDEDGPVTATERWALAQIRAVPHGSVVVHKRDGEIKRVEKCWSEVAPEGR